MSRLDLGGVGKVIAVGALVWVGWSQLAEDETLRTQADEAACRGRACSAEFVRKRRQAFGFRFEYRTFGERSQSVSVTCTRPLWVFGDYRCEVETLDSALDDRFGR